MKIAVGMPIVDNVPGECFGSLAAQVGEIAKEGHEPVIVNVLNVFPHDIARNRLLKNIRKLDVDMVYFLDSDMVIPQGAFKTLLKAHRETEGSTLMSAFYYRRGYPYTSVWCRSAHDRTFQVNASSGVHEIDSTGLGCALLDMKWAEKNLNDPWFKMKENDEGTLIWEDVFFCLKIHSMGGRVFGCADVRCGHVVKRGIIEDGNVDKLRKDFVIETVWLEEKHEN